MRGRQCFTFVVAMATLLAPLARASMYRHQGVDWTSTGLCDASDRQSPIAFALKHINEANVDQKAIILTANQPLENLKFTSKPEEQLIEITPVAEGDTMGYTIQVAEHVVYEMKNMHFHAPSEHTFDADAYKKRALELHIVHTEQNGGRALVVGVTFDPVPGGYSPFLASVIDNLRGISRPLEFHDHQMLPTHGPVDVMHYKGSLTTPPCSEIVEWYVRSAPVAAAPEQLEFFYAQLKGDENHGNFRMPMNMIPFPGNWNNQIVYRTQLFQTDLGVIRPIIGDVGVAKGVHAPAAMHAPAEMMRSRSYRSSASPKITHHRKPPVYAGLPGPYGHGPPGPHVHGGHGQGPAHHGRGGQHPPRSHHHTPY
eukprot:Selendium_serpulae@DN5711_c0_g1_i2.p1